MKVDREHIRNEFAAYVGDYDARDGKIALKIAHTYRVAELCDRIATNLELSSADVDLAWTIGMLHDIGRFEQVKRYGTFQDALSVDHAKFGVELLEDVAFIAHFLPERTEDELIKTAIWNHNEYRIKEGLSDRELMFCKIIRDADKIDILRVNYETPMEIIYNVETEVLKNAVVSDAVMKAFYEKKAILHSLKETSIDRLVGHISLVYELEYPISKEIVKEQGYLELLMNFESINEKTMKQLEDIRCFMEQYLYDTGSHGEV